MYANRAAIEHLGFDSLEELQRHSLDSIMADYIVHDEHGRPLSMSDVPSVRLLRGQPAQPLLMRTVNRLTGQARWQLLKTADSTIAAKTPAHVTNENAEGVLSLAESLWPG